MKKDMQTGTKREKEKEILELMVKICCRISFSFSLLVDRKSTRLNSSHW